MAWAYLFVAGLFEVAWAIGLKYTEGFTKLVPSVFTIIGMIASFALLSVALRSLPIGTAYAVWTGIGAVGTAIIGILLFEPTGMVIFIGMLLASLLGLIIGGQLVRNTLLLGDIFGKQDKAAELTAQLKASVAELKKLTADRGDGLLVLTTGGRMAAFGRGTRFGLIHDVFGVEEAVKDLKVGRHGQSVSFEFLLETDPDWLFVMDRDAAIGREGTAAAEMMDNELVEATTAGSKDQIVYLDPASWYLLDNSGIGVMQNSVDELIKVFSAAR